MPIDRSTIVIINRTVGVIGLLVGLALIGASGTWLMRTRQFMATAAVADGHVTANQPEVWVDRDPRNPGESSGTTRTSYRAVVQFIDGRGRAVTYRDTIALSPPSFVVGQRVRIFYNPEDPRRALIDRGTKIYLIPLAVLTVGGLMMLGSFQRLFDRRLETRDDVPTVPVLAMSQDVVTRPPAM